MNRSLIRLALFSSFVPIAWTQYSTGTPSTANSSQTSSTETGSSCHGGNTHRVSVGSGGFKFEPNVLFAHPGDTVVFTFFPTNHSVVRAAYTGAESSGNPCVPIEALHPGSPGFFSGNKLVSGFPDGTNDVTWNLSIVDRNPIWFYCDAPGSCHPNGMVGVINPNTSGSFQRQHDAAVAAPFQLGPGQASSLGGGTSAATTSSAKISAGAIAGIAIGAAAFLALIGTLCYFAGKTMTYKSFFEHRSKHSSQPSADNPAFAYTSPHGGGPPGFYDARFSNSTAFDHQRAGSYPGYPGDARGFEGVSPVESAFPHSKPPYETVLPASAYELHERPPAMTEDAGWRFR